MLSKNKIKLIHSLAYKKYRDQNDLFVAEGTKTILEIAPYADCEILCATTEWLSENKLRGKETIEINEEELKKISFLTTPQKVLAVCKKTVVEYKPEELQRNLSLALDNIQDPGNLGTIIRIADWFGIQHVFCSTATVDVFNPKTVQATMGAIGRVKVHYVDLPVFLREQSRKLPLWGTFLDGKNIYKENLSPNGIIVMGNEGNGISPEIEKLISHKLFIPNFPANAETSESLNVAVATAIVCSEFRRR